MSKWACGSHIEDTAKWFVCDVKVEKVEILIKFISKDLAEQIVREHNAHDELVSCLSVMLKITCGDCSGENFKRCRASEVVCVLSASARAAIATAKGDG